jgi:hypothetical protein
MSVVLQAAITGSVEYGFQGVDLEVVFFVDVFLYFVKQIAFQMNKFAAYFTLQVKVFLANLVVPDILITGASFA